MTEQEDRLRRELRATTAVNRQLLAQLESSGEGGTVGGLGNVGIRTRLRRSAKKLWPQVRRRLPVAWAESLRRLDRRVL